jgi:crotonobetainyl-CoA:carnitine CoA-transferase CaiB-like acyl-CoA transferase
MGRPDLAGDGAYGTQARRLADRAAVDALVGGWAAGLDREALLSRCLSAGAPVAPLNDIADIFADPHVRARGNLQTVEEPLTGEALAVPGTLPHLADTPGRIDRLGPGLGQHTDEVLGDLLGLSPSQLADLRDRGVV